MPAAPVFCRREIVASGTDEHGTWWEYAGFRCACSSHTPSAETLRIYSAQAYDADPTLEMPDPCDCAVLTQQHGQYCAAITVGSMVASEGPSHRLVERYERGVRNPGHPYGWPDDDYKMALVLAEFTADAPVWTGEMRKFRLSTFVSPTDPTTEYHTGFLVRKNTPPSSEAIHHFGCHEVKVDYSSDPWFLEVRVLGKVVRFKLVTHGDRVEGPGGGEEAQP